MTPPRFTRIVLVAAAAVAVWGPTPTPSAAQATPDPAHPGHIRLHIQARWIHQHQQPEFVRFHPDTRTVHLSEGSGQWPRELKVTLPSAPLTPGLTWTDTAAFGDDRPDGLGDSYHAIRTHRVVGDTVVAGRPLPWIRTEATVRHRSAVVLGGTWRQERGVTGTSVRAAVVDTATGLLIAGADTARWQGTGILQDTVSGSFTSDVRYQRMRTWTWYDSASYQALTDSTRRARAGMLRFNDNDDRGLAERLARGDSTLADSLVAVWRAQPGDGGRVYNLLRLYPDGDRWGSSRVDSLEQVFALARGDTVAALRVARRAIPHQDSRRRLTRFQAEFLLPYLDDPGRLWLLGVPEQYDFLSLAQMLFRSSPLLAPDTSQWGCEPAACELFLDQLERASEPRLRDAALVGLFARDPDRWYDRLMARHEAGSQLTGEAWALAQGRLRDRRPSIPPVGADWRAWREWWPGRVLEPRALWALRLHTARTGRDPVAELVATWPPAEDSARVVLGEMLRDLGAIPDPTGDELLVEVLSGDSARIQVAQRYLRQGLLRSGEAVTPEVSEDLLAPLLDSLLTRGDAPWPAAPGVIPGAGPRIHPFGRSSHGVEGAPVFVLTEHLSAGVLDRLPADVRAISRQDWDARDPRAGGYLLEFRFLRRWGPFRQVVWQWTALARRAPDESPSGYAGGGSLTLVQTEGGWVIVARGAWIT